MVQTPRRLWIAGNISTHERRKREGNDRDDVTDDARARDARFYRSVRLMR